MCGWRRRGIRGGRTRRERGEGGGSGGGGGSRGEVEGKWRGRGGTSCLKHLLKTVDIDGNHKRSKWKCEVP